MISFCSLPVFLPDVTGIPVPLLDRAKREIAVSSGDFPDR